MLLGVAQVATAAFVDDLDRGAGALAVALENVTAQTFAVERSGDGLCAVATANTVATWTDFKLPVRYVHNGHHAERYRDGWAPADFVAYVEARRVPERSVVVTLAPQRAGAGAARDGGLARVRAARRGALEEALAPQIFRHEEQVRHLRRVGGERPRVLGHVLVDGGLDLGVLAPRAAGEDVHGPVQVAVRLREEVADRAVVERVVEEAAVGEGCLPSVTGSDFFTSAGDIHAKKDSRRSTLKVAVFSTPKMVRDRERKGAGFWFHGDRR